MPYVFLSMPMFSITIKLWRNYVVATITLWPVITESCDVIMRNYDEKIVFTVKSFISNQLLIMIRLFVYLQKM